MRRPRVKRRSRIHIITRVIGGLIVFGNRIVRRGWTIRRPGAATATGNCQSSHNNGKQKNCFHLAHPFKQHELFDPQKPAQPRVAPFWRIALFHTALSPRSRQTRACQYSYFQYLETGVSASSRTCSSLVGNSTQSAFAACCHPFVSIRRNQEHGAGFLRLALFSE